MAAVKSTVVDRWSAFQALVEGAQFRSWAFRGQQDADWRLTTALARRLEDAGVHRNAWTRQEERTTRIFRRKAHLFLDHVPAHDDTFQWLALMQHHGAPTRLLDVTWSPYVAAFFALERATRDAAVWALSPPQTNASVDAILGPLKSLEPDNFNFRGSGNYESAFLPNRNAFVLVGEPYIMNKRLVAQEGAFAVPGKIDVPVDEILALGSNTDQTIWKIILRTSSLRREAMRSLYNMNITNASLFPDLEGLARSMAYELEFHWAFDPHTMGVVPGFA